MTEDIVYWLRKSAEHYRAIGGPHNPNARFFNEAADEIERLRIELEAMRSIKEKSLCNEVIERLGEEFAKIKKH